MQVLGSRILHRAQLPRLLLPLAQKVSPQLPSYLAEIIVADEKQLTEIITPSKSAFATVISTNLASLEALDESYELEEDVELVTKHNIEKEIVALLRQGFNKCTYSTDQLCSELT